MFKAQAWFRAAGDTVIYTLMHRGGTVVKHRVSNFALYPLSLRLRTLYETLRALPSHKHKDVDIVQQEQENHCVNYPLNC